MRAPISRLPRVRVPEPADQARAVGRPVLGLAELRGYIEANEGFIPNYGERWRQGETIATGFVESTVYDRARLAPGDEVRGPAVVEEEGSTLVIGPGGIARVATSGNLVVTLP